MKRADADIAAHETMASAANTDVKLRIEANLESRRSIKIALGKKHGLMACRDRLRNVIRPQPNRR